MAGAFAAQSDDSEADVQVRLTGDSWGWRWSAERAAAAPPELTLGLEGPGGRLPSAAAGRAVSAWSASPAPANSFFARPQPPSLLEPRLGLLRSGPAHLTQDGARGGGITYQLGRPPTQKLPTRPAAPGGSRPSR